MFSMFLDVCKNFINYSGKLWISIGGGTDRNSNGNIPLRAGRNGLLSLFRLAAGLIETFSLAVTYRGDVDWMPVIMRTPGVKGYFGTNEIDRCGGSFSL